MSTFPPRLNVGVSDPDARTVRAAEKDPESVPSRRLCRCARSSKVLNRRPLSEDCSDQGATDDAVPMSVPAQKRASRHTTALGIEHVEPKTGPSFLSLRCGSMTVTKPSRSWLVGRPRPESSPTHKIPPSNPSRLRDLMVGQINGEAVFPFFRSATLRGNNWAAR